MIYVVRLLINLQGFAGEKGIKVDLDKKEHKVVPQLSPSIYSYIHLTRAGGDAYFLGFLYARSSDQLSEHIGRGGGLQL